MSLLFALNFSLMLKVQFFFNLACFWYSSHQCIKQIFGRDVQQKEGFNCVNYSTTHLSIETLVEHGWDCQRLYLGFGEYRIDCNVKTD